MFAPCGPAATADFDVGDPVGLSTNQLITCTDNLGEVALTALIGFACEPATGTTAGSRVTNTADGFGVVENQMRAYWPFDAPGLLLRSKHFRSAGTATEVEKEGTEIGDLCNLTGSNGTNIWGFEEEAPTAGTDAEFQIVAILDENMNPIDADATVAAGTAPAVGEGWVVVRPVRQLLSQLTEGGA